jgi:hypothetical protein
MKRPRLQLEQEYGKDHPWPEFDRWHKVFHETAAAGPIDWPCRQPLRCFWRWTRKTGVVLYQGGIIRRPDERDILFTALVDAVALIDKLQKGGGSWTLAEVKRLETIRFLSLGA